MNIAYIMRYWPVYGGGETITATLANEFIKRGHNVTILYIYRNDIVPKPYDIDQRIKEYQLNTLECSENNVTAFREIIIKSNIDVMINQWANVSLCNKARTGTKAKLITCWHLDIIQPKTPMGYKQLIYAKLFGLKAYKNWSKKQQLKNHSRNYLNSDKYVFLSKSFENHYKELSGQIDTDNKLTAISNPLTYNLEYDVKELDSKKKEVLFVGRIYEYHKRVSYVLRIWKKIEENNSFNDWTLKIVGDGPDMQKSKELAISLGLKRYSFEGFRNPQPYYKDASIFMMTSAFEGFGMTLVEAQQYGVVPMAMDTYRSLHDILTNNSNGIISENDNLELYTQMLIKLMGNKEYRNELSLKALESCKRFKLDTIANQWESVFNEIIR